MKNIFILILTMSFAHSIMAEVVDSSSCISFKNGTGYFALSYKNQSAPLFASSKDHHGVIRALNDLKTDIGKVTGNEPSVVFDDLSLPKEIVIIGTLGKNPVINQLVQNKKLDVKDITGKWEHFLIQVIEKPFEGVDKALVIVGSDKRGTIYGIYNLSEQIGVSPWYWWADVPVEHKDAVFVKPNKITQGPSVKYRGIFLNDEAPALTNWIKEKFGFAKPSKYPPVGNEVVNYGHEFYSKMFELLLRLKANYLWPAMWSNAFNEDDPKNSRLADEYGIVMGTSHQEPMLRSQQEWDRRYYGSLGHWNYSKHADTLENFWREGVRRNKNYESIITMGLRGANDTEIAGDMKANIAMVEGIVKKQQKIISEEMNPDITKVPQSWCLYKEIMEYYNEGLRVPDNITLLWSDDNWGNIRRLPNEEERLRSGGAGVYYHFDYHGGPRSYQWINTNPIAKIWDQMSLAKQYGADRIWIVNVGHFKGYEFPMEYFLSLAWNTDRWNNSNINEFTRLWAAREFGYEYAEEIAEIISKYTKFNGRRKPESLSPKTYSLINYCEAENVVFEFNKITAQAEDIYNKLSNEKRDAFYQLVLFPTKASALVNELYVTAGKNELYAQQRRASANDMATKTRNLFQADTALMGYFNRDFANGKWNHFMDQTHLGYIDWSDPKTNNLDAINLTEIQVPDSAIMGVSIEESELSWPGSNEKAVLPEFDIFSNSQHYLEIFNRGKNPFNFTINTNVSWLTFSDTIGTIGNSDKRIIISLDESKLPKGKTDGIVKIAGAGKEVSIKVNAFNPTEVNSENLKGFVESGGLISIEVEHYSKNIEQGDRKWIRVEDYGLTLSGMRATASVNAAAATPGKDAPCLEYPMYLFSKDSVQINLITSPLLNFMPGRDIKIAVSIDDKEPQYITNVPDKFKVQYSNPAWALTVVNQARNCKTTMNIEKPGYHTLKVWMIDPGVVLQKIIVNTGGLKPSYLGPPESNNGVNLFQKKTN
ncbi:MAG: glycosyl hydrolase 115 family protein [Bacteroidetes bacterium]|nr:glycosyl hydrolase 115 family protein [Bacteroidota bacterium]MBU1115207.1 glycosyl hydrolase 115 family protein [Bacteroidota bacterium]MBU1797226.1 glycosyl hydrolase 115 family protein [Bacteroidota bacterium]